MSAAVAIGVDGSSLAHATGEHVEWLRESGELVVVEAPEVIDFDSVMASLAAFVSRHLGLEAAELRARLRWWYRGENHALRRRMEAVHRKRCERGRGVLINRVTGEAVLARCKSWRECQYCAWLYGRSVERLWHQVRGIRAFVVFTMPAELGNPSNREHLQAQAQAKRRLEERLFRKFGRRFASLWAREHNTHGAGAGRLHLNMVWDQDWVDQAWLSEVAEACGFGRVVHISRAGYGGRAFDGEARGRNVHHYAVKALRYAAKAVGEQGAWPKGTRRWGASRAARAQMKRPETNPDWFWSPFEPPHTVEIEGRTYLVGRPKTAMQWATERKYWLLPERYLPSRAIPAPGG